MILKQKIEVMQHFEGGGEIQYGLLTNGDWFDTVCPLWDWHHADYRIKPKPVELLYEWWIENDNVFVDTSLATEKYVEFHYGGYKGYGKTGRWFNPATKVFGG